MNIRPKTKEMLAKFFKELIREVGRVYLLASPVVTAYLIQVFEVMKNTGKFTLDYRYVIAISVLAILKGLDRALYETGTIEKGITRF